MRFSSDLLIYVIVPLVLISANVEGKRGCPNYGHSCYGGVAKRQGEDAFAGEEIKYINENMESINEEMIRRQPKQFQLLLEPEYDLNLGTIKQWLQWYRKIINEPAQEQ